MALAAGHVGVRAGQRKRGLIVIERRVHPGGGVVARFARGGECGRDVIGIFCALEVAFMAGVAILGRAGEVAGCVALHALHRSVRAGEREERGVIETRWRPAGGGVAHGAVRRESGRDMVGTAGALEIGLVARVAVGGR